MPWRPRDEGARPSPCLPRRRKPSRSRSRRVSSPTAADFTCRWIGKRKAPTRHTKRRRRQEKGSRKAIRSFRSRCMTASRASTRSSSCRSAYCRLFTQATIPKDVRGTSARITSALFIADGMEYCRSEATIVKRCRLSARLLPGNLVRPAAKTAAACPADIRPSAARQGLRHSEDRIGGREFAYSSQALDVGPAHDAVAIDEELAFHLGPLPLQVGAVGLVLRVAVELVHERGGVGDRERLGDLALGIDSCWLGRSREFLRRIRVGPAIRARS